MQDGVAALLDKQAIQELVTDYAAAIDDRDSGQRLTVMTSTCGCVASDNSQFNAATSLLNRLQA